MENIRKKQIKKLFNNFTGIICSNGIWFSGIEGYGLYKMWWKNGQLYINAYYNKDGLLIDKYKEWYKNEDLIFEIKFKDNELIAIDYINPKYINKKYWFNYWNEYNKKNINFYDKIKEMYNDKYKKKTN